MSVAEAHEHEQPHLMPMPSAFDGYIEVIARVSSTCLVTVKRNRYSVPCHLAGHRVSVRLYPERVVVYAEQQAVADHRRALDRDQVVYDWLHYVPLIERKPGALRNGAPFGGLPDALRTLQLALLRRPGGDRVMADVLSCVPTFGLEAVLVAVELVIASGAISVDHVRNVLARLRETPTLTVDTALRLQEEPLADPDRYDQLRCVEVSHD
jgi:hypothetical protein